MIIFAIANPDFPIVQVSLAQIPWYHHTSLLSKVKDEEERIFYIISTAQHNWSKDTMLLQVKSNLYERQGRAITNFNETLPATQEMVRHEIKKILNDSLPESYNRKIFSEKTDIVFQHLYE